SAAWSNGLSECGVSAHNSPAASAASGGGGVTGVGGGGGAAGGGGGGGRQCRPNTKNPLEQKFQGICILWNGAKGVRTPDLCTASATLSQLSYGPVFLTQDIL